MEFSGVVYANIPYFIEFDEWNESYRSAILKSSPLLDQLPERSKQNKNLTHFYLGIDIGNEYSQIDIVCEGNNLTIDDQDYVLHDDFDWLYEE